jgi:hypothetical protein
VVHEVSDDLRFTGGRLATASRQELEAWLAEHGVKLNPSQTMNGFLASDGQTVD